jgi:hypothetical protein
MSNNNKENKIQWMERKNPPTEDCVCYVTNIRSGMACYMAIYRKNNDYFWKYDPTCLDNPPLDITHYLVLPPPPDFDNKQENAEMQIRWIVKDKRPKKPAKAKKTKK